MTGVRDASHLDADVTESYDAIIVGSGAGGAVVAKELAEGGFRVAILEEGGWHRSHRDLAFEAGSRLYRDKGLTTTLGSPIIAVPMGKAFGGTTVINSGTCFRVPDKVFRSWREKRGLTALTTSDFDRAYSRVEREINVQPSDYGVMSRTNTLMKELFEREGFHGAPLLRNIRGCEGCGMCCYGCTSGAKQSMDVSYLPKALAAGAVAYTHARAVRVLLERTPGGSGRGRLRAVGVLAEAVNAHSRRTGARITLRAPRVIVAAGTFHTPQLLRRSGIARGNPHLGRHLTIHPATKVFAEFDEEIRGWEGTPQAFGLDAFHDEGILFEGIFTPPDITGLTVPFVGKRLVEFVKRYAHMSSFGFLISDESEGRMVRLPFFGYAFLYSLTPGDVRRIKKGIAFLSRVFLRGGARRVYPLIHRASYSAFETLEDVDRFEAAELRAGDIDCMAFHPLGTCRMSASPSDGVCDQRHEVYGTSGLYLCDGSVIPTSLGVNPQLTIMAFATRLAELLLGNSHGQPPRISA